MNSIEKEELLTFLDKGRDAFLTAIGDVPESMATQSPGPGRWTILECTEHVAIVEHHLLSQINIAVPTKESVPNKAREVAIRRRGANRDRPVDAPEGAIPTGRFSSITEGVEHFLANRIKTIEFVQRSEDLRGTLTTHPILGSVNCYEMLLMMAVHPQRHAKQIDEIRNALGR